MRVVGPDPARRWLRALASSGDSVPDVVWLSPKARVTVRKKYRLGAGIPNAAHSFAFVYPRPELHAELSKLDLTYNAWAFTLLSNSPWAAIEHGHAYDTRTHTRTARACCVSRACACRIDASARAVASRVVHCSRRLRLL